MNHVGSVTFDNSIMKAPNNVGGWGAEELAEVVEIWMKPFL